MWYAVKYIEGTGVNIKELRGLSTNISEKHVG